MDQRILKFIAANHIACLSVPLLDGSPHGAAVHFACDSENFTFIVLTDRTSKKAEALTKNGTSKVSMVIGFDESTMETMQLDGEAVLPEGSALERAKECYFAKFPDREKYADDPDSLFIVFKPLWWRWTKSRGPDKGMIASDD